MGSGHLPVVLKLGGLAVFAIAAALLAAPREPARATFPGANGKIAFYGLYPGEAGIFTMNADGSGRTNLTNAVGTAPAWSPDGLRIAFGAPQSGSFDVYVMNADGSSPTRLTSHPSSDGSPTWSPDGSRIAFMTHRDGNWEIYVMNADGSGQTNLTNAPTRDDMNPDWSPDGSKIAFSGCGGDGADICVMNPDGSGLTNLSNSPADYESFPSWSPDGSKIASSDERQGHYGNSDVYVMNADGSGLTNLTNHPARVDGYQSWSPDGSKVVFVSTRDGIEEIYVMNPDGSGQTRVTYTSVNVLEASPDWQPLVDTDGDRLYDYDEVYVIGTDPYNPDTDEDGCWDGAELAPQSEAASGGGRDPLSFWDFIDQWVGGAKDQRVTASDIAAVIARFATSRTPPPAEQDALAEALTPPASATGYHASADRGGLSGPRPWDLLSPDGHISVADIGAVVAQFGHSCA